MPFPFVATLDCAFSSGLGDRNKHLPCAGQTLDIFHGNNRIPPDLPARRSSQDVIAFDPHSRRNCCRTRCENKAHQNDSSFHVVPKRFTTIEECINRDNCLKQFVLKKSPRPRNVGLKFANKRNTTTPMNPNERFRGCLLGRAVGDAIGTTVEFRQRGTFEPLKDMIGGGPFRLLPGQWTDDTSMALCLATSLVERSGFDPVDQMRRYCRWADHGYLSSTGPVSTSGQQ